MNAGHWWSIIISAILLTTALIFIIAKRGATVKYKGDTVIIPGQITGKLKGTPLGILLDELINVLTAIRAKLKSSYLKKLEDEHGVSDDLLNSHDDSRFIHQCLGNIVFSGNGIRSIKTILEQVTAAEEYMRNQNDEDFDKFTARVTRSCVQTYNKYLDTEYDNDVYYCSENDSGCMDTIKRKRLITVEEIFRPAYQEKVYQIIKTELIGFFRYAISVKNSCN